MGRMSICKKKMKRQKQKLTRKMSCKKKLSFPSPPKLNSSVFNDHVDVITPPITPSIEVVSMHGANDHELVEPISDSKGIYSADSSDEDDHRWDDLRDEAAKIRLLSRNKKLLRARCYGGYTDLSPTVDESSVPTPEAVNKLSPIDRTTVSSYIQDLKQREKDAVHLARVTRNYNTHLKQEFLEFRASANKEKEKVRFFWQQQLLEGTTRSGKMVKKALQKQRSLK